MCKVCVFSNSFLKWLLKLQALKTAVHASVCSRSCSVLFCPLPFVHSFPLFSHTSSSPFLCSSSSLSCVQSCISEVQYPVQSKVCIMLCIIFTAANKKESMTAVFNTSSVVCCSEDSKLNLTKAKKKSITVYAYYWIWNIFHEAY